MKTLRIALLGLILGTGMVSVAYARTNVGLSVNLGYPVYAAPVYVAPPPVYYVPPPPVYYAPPPPAYVSPYGYVGYGYDNGWHRGWDRHHRHHGHHRH